jgi:sialate O-acetylesterase
MKRLIFIYINIILVFTGIYQVFGDELAIPSVFSDHMVLQRDVKVPIWGWAEPGDKITVALEREKKRTIADKDGKWLIRLNKHAAGGPFNITITGKTSINLQDVYFGEVWLCSGQSNMQMLLGKSERSWIAGGVTDFEKEIADSDYPQIRMLTVPFDDKTMVFEPKKDSGGNWIVCNPQTSAKFAAIPFFFARAIHQKLKVPIGLLNVTLGGSCVEAWISNDSARSESSMKSAMTEWDTAWDEYLKNLKNNPLTVNPINHRSTPTVLYNGMLAPLVPYAMKGVIWYQGEANAAKPVNYADHFMTLIRAWRRQWGIGDFPFLYVQLAPIGGENYSGLREAQRQALILPNTAMAVCTDTDSGLHPLNKKPVGERLALAARALAYGEKIEYSGPLPEIATAENGNICLTFSHVGMGLASSDSGELKSFEIAGADGVFIPATARIDGEKILVSNVKVAQPVVVRYGWKDSLIRNLINKNGLPASPFCINIKKGG